ncbi:MAG: 2-hydroxyacid dehydrogenase [Rhodobacterales bacterium]|nr:2-hydroxyacid dehydrogenase [Rhodobacterales bacterium]
MVALLGTVPPDVRDAVAARADLIDAAALAALPADRRQGITRGLTTAMNGLDAAMMALLPNLASITSVGAGMDRFDPPALAARGIALYPTPDVMTEDTAEAAVGLVFALLRNIVGNDRFVRRGDWARGRAPYGRRVSACRVGIVGLGRIGGRIAAKLTALGCDVSYTGRGEKEGPWRFEPDLGQLARQVDVLVLSCAGGDATRGLVDARILGLLGPDGYLVNVARGSVVDEPALLDALERGGIAGAALDVFASEPNLDARFLDLPNCILQPHASVYTRENRRDLMAEVIRLLGL